MDVDQWSKCLTLQPGLQLHCIELNRSCDEAVAFQRDDAFLEFGCLLSGRVCGCVHIGNGKKRHFGGGPGHTWCSFHTKAHGTIEYLSGQVIYVVLFLISGPLLKSLPLLQSDRTALGKQHSANDSFSITGNLTPTVRQVIQQIMRIIEREEAPNRLLLISKAYELLFHLSSVTQEEEGEEYNQIKRQGVKRAQDILNRNLASPPTLAEIARQSGLCITNLAEEFRKQFGTTVFGYLRQQRLERAKELITLYGMNASEAAWEVGYSSLSSFHRAFYARYGTTPGSYCRKA